MEKYKFYRVSNYIVISDNLTEESFYGFVKEVQVAKSNANKPSYKISNIKDFDSGIALAIEQLLKEDGSPYTESEFDTFYRENTGNFNGGGSAPGDGVKSVTGSLVDNTDPENPIINSPDLAPDITVTEDNVDIPNGAKTRMYTLTGSSPQVITLPSISEAVGSIYFITNDSSSSVTIDSNGGANDIWDGGTIVNTKEVVSGTILRIINDGISYKIL